MARALGSWCLLLLILSSTFDDVVSFQAAGPTRVRSSFAPSQTSASSLRSRVVPRRRLKKIPTKNPAQRRRRSGQQLDDFPWEEAETKSLVSDKGEIRKRRMDEERGEAPLSSYHWLVRSFRRSPPAPTRHDASTQLPSRETTTGTTPRAFCSLTWRP